MDLGMKIRVKPLSLPVASRYAKWFFVSLFFLSFGFGLYDGYANLYRSGWTEEEKRSYIESAFRETEFRERPFRNAVESVSARADAYASERSDDGTDLFAPISER